MYDRLATTLCLNMDQQNRPLGLALALRLIPVISETEPVAHASRRDDEIVFWPLIEIKNALI